MKTDQEILEMSSMVEAQLLVLLDIRSLLTKLVEKKGRTKVISTEVVLNDKETALLDSIEA